MRRTSLGLTTSSRNLRKTAVSSSTLIVLFPGYTVPSISSGFTTAVASMNGSTRCRGSFLTLRQRTSSSVFRPQRLAAPTLSSSATASPVFMRRTWWARNISRFTCSTTRSPAQRMSTRSSRLCLVKPDCRHQIRQPGAARPSRRKGWRTSSPPTPARPSPAKTSSFMSTACCTRPTTANASPTTWARNCRAYRE